MHDSVFLCFFVVSMRFFFVFLRAARRGKVVGKFEQLMGVWGLWGWLRLVEPDEIYIRNYSRKFGRPARNIKDPGIFPSRLYTVQFESIILLNIQWNFFLNTLPTSVTLLCKVKKGFPGRLYEIPSLVWMLPMVCVLLYCVCFFLCMFKFCEVSEGLFGFICESNNYNLRSIGYPAKPLTHPQPQYYNFINDFKTKVCSQT